MNKMAGSYNERQIKLFLPIVQHINNLSDEYDSLSDEQIKEKSLQLKKTISKLPLPKKIKDKEGNLQLENEISPLDEYIPEAFALVKQACKRLVGTKYLVKWVEQLWNMVPYDVQLIGGINLHKWKISEMRTGEWKTLVGILPAYLNALTRRGVHIVTVNDYLTSRDSDQMRIVFEFLGLSVGCVTKAVPPHLRREEYAKDITYVENSELGFDYLRDNLVKSLDERNVLRRTLHYAIVDEVDSILIDESRTPLIISEPDAEPTEKYAYYAQIVPLLTPSKNKKKVSKWFLHDMLNDVKNETSDTADEGDYHVDEKTKTVALSSQGIAKLEEILKVENLYRDLGYEEIHHIENALKAHACYIHGKEYLVNNGEILIIDENTGRAQVGRRFSQGLHQAIEAKEQVTIQKESKTLATITYQNFFKLYHKLSGMTGTATTEWEEFDSIYNLRVLAIPTHKDVIRVDHNDKVYFNQHAKRKFVIDQINFAHEIGQPLLIGTSSIQTSEFMSSLLNKANIVHSVLNAKFHEQEAQIISRAGKYGSVVVATNMAWRGTDIKLEEWLNERLAKNYASWIERMVSWNNKNKIKHTINITLYSNKEFDYTIDALKNEFSNINEDIVVASHKSEQSFWDYKIKINLNTKKKFAHEVFANIIISHREAITWEWIAKDFHYGLGIIGTEKHESRRIDNQLRGRAGRQWDAGMSVFYVALDDSIMRKMGGEKIQGVASLLLPKSELENLELTQSQFTSSITRAQKQMEWRHFGIRKHLFDYDSVIDKQRHSIYARRDSILQALHTIYHPEEKNSEDNNSTVIDSIINLIQQSVENFFTTQQTLGTSEDELIELVNKEYGLQLEAWYIKSSLYNESAQHITAHIISNLNNAQELLWEETFTRICANIYLSMIDKNRVEHIDEMQYLREKVGLVWYAQLDPLVIYKKESYDKYQALNKIINQSTVNIIANTDFIRIADQIKNQQQQHDMQIIQAQEEANEDIMQKLKSAAGQVERKIVQKNTSNWFKASSSNNNEFEIIEMDENQDIHKNTNNIRTKLRPNDKVNVRHADGRMEFDVKYKKVSDDIKAGKCQII
jgi:preprotein translocase subunit SecA